MESIHGHRDCMYETIFVHVGQRLGMDMKKCIWTCSYGPAALIIAWRRDLFNCSVAPAPVGSTAISEVLADGRSGEFSIAD